MDVFRLGRLSLNRGIARKFIVGILLFSSLITLLATSLQLYLDYSYDINSIEKNLEQIENNHLDGIVHNIWVSNQHQLLTQLDGILRLPDVQYIEIQENKDLKLKRGDVTGTTSSPVISRCSTRTEDKGSLLVF